MNYLSQKKGFLGVTFFEKALGPLLTAKDLTVTSTLKDLYDLTKNMQYLAIKGDIKEPYKIDIDMATKILDPIYENNQADISLKMMYS